MRKMGGFPDVLRPCIKQLAPFSLVNYLQELATLFHKFYDRPRVIDEDKVLSSERLTLVNAVGTVLENGLKLLGVFAPDKM